MGYTHYWKTTKPVKLNEEQWGNLCDVIREIITECKKQNIKLVIDCDEDKAPLIRDDEICFNGFGDLGHENFYLQTQMDSFSFCKTARKPYDLAVTATLLILHHIEPNIIITSDGNKDNWLTAQKLLTNLGYFVEIPETI